MAAQPESTAPLSTDTSTIGAEVIHAIRGEAALRLSDIVLRRTTVGAAGHPGAATLQACAAIAARELDWSPERTREEIADVERVYRAVGAFCSQTRSQEFGKPARAFRGDRCQSAGSERYRLSFLALPILAVLEFDDVQAALRHREPVKDPGDAGRDPEAGIARGQADDRRRRRSAPCGA